MKVKFNNSDVNKSVKSTFKAGENIWQLEVLEPKLLLSADLMPGVQNIEGELEQPGERDAYEFVVTEQTKLFFDGVAGDHFTWSLKGQQFGKNFSSTELNSADHRFLDLVPDTYRLNIDARNDYTGTYKFRLIGEDAAIQLTVNQPVNNTLTPASQAALYKVDLSAGDRVFFAGNPTHGAATWSIFDPDASQVLSNRPLTDNHGFVAAKTGTYWLSIEGNNAQESLSYAFTLHASTPSVTALVLNERYEADFSQPFQSFVYQADSSSKCDSIKTSHNLTGCIPSQ